MVNGPREKQRVVPAADALAVIDARGTVTGWTEGARRLTGHAAPEVTGRPAADLVTGDPRAAWRELRTSGAAVVGVRHRDGRSVELALRLCPVVGRRREYVVTVTPDDAGRALGELAFRQASMSMSVFDTEQRYLRMNDVACAVMGQPEAAFLHRYFPDTVEDAEHSRGFRRHLEMVAETGRPVHYESWTRSPSGRRMHAWTTEMWPLRDPAGDLLGVALAAFDSSEQYWARQRLAMLNEAAAGIGTRLDVVQTARELAELVVPRLADFASVDLLDSVLQGDEPTVGQMDAGVELRRVAHHSLTAGVPEAAIALGAADVYPAYAPPARALATGLPVLARSGDPDLDRWFGRHTARSAKLRDDDGTGTHDIALMAVPLTARGAALGVAVFVRLLTPEKPEVFDDDDESLARELVSRAAVCVDNARRYTRERTTALALQRSLLPQTVAGQAAVESASRYLPALSQAGVGGDWFDVIPLSGTRVALVVGDVVGHGLHASVTMGRLRTAVWTLADVDLPPDELLTHLDDLVGHLGTDESGGSAEIGATCLYAVYDPVSRRCTLAAAGHPPPVVRYPDGRVEVVKVSAGPMLGVGGLPFEATELELPEGAVLALYTDGLVEARDRDLDTGTAVLCRALAAPADSLEEICDTVLGALLPETPGDDVALLVARTRALDAEQVAVWDLPADPAVVAVARKHVTEQLTRWGLDEAAFVTELVVSELVTNAIRYGGDPIQLRLIRDRTLICEVSDASSTSPHLRRARTFDEGGRGLLLVAQLTDRWGTRPTGTGKTIWAEQELPPAP
ncbi:SpoIIE family protein phosphatase [Streptomyces sp. WI04-05B]|uniref:ATP-binding SpoIIE family protein phosphatase n=1 Tax=Streptomyces TaxID=1883 RepID=UPI0029A488D4|nr:MULTISPECIES: SpoIIE family protein phosphatase [unclassified Streptomyces]MDX2545710.1 SpoIIE family protein phosphatase [Streptomyces sp. WI04-05B]MDX2583441.1 SpoIIE family protein phosphatase [Streptomyces sp. WI04-05A]